MVGLVGKGLIHIRGLMDIGLDLPANQEQSQMKVSYIDSLLQM